jgi:hypothetical protein
VQLIEFLANVLGMPFTDTDVRMEELEEWCKDFRAYQKREEGEPTCSMEELEDRALGLRLQLFEKGYRRLDLELLEQTNAMKFIEALNKEHVEATQDSILAYQSKEYDNQMISYYNEVWDLVRHVRKQTSCKTVDQKAIKATMGPKVTWLRHTHEAHTLFPLLSNSYVRAIADSFKMVQNAVGEVSD